MYVIGIVYDRLFDKYVLGRPSNPALPSFNEPDTNIRIPTDLEDWDARFAATNAKPSANSGSYNELHIIPQDRHDRLDDLNLPIPPTPARTAARIRVFGEGLALAMDVYDREYNKGKR